MDDKTSDVSKSTLPFNNLFLNSGVVHGLNNWAIYFLTITLTLFCYFFAPSITFIHLVYLATQNGMTLEQILANPDILQDSAATGIDMNYILLSVFGLFVFAFFGLWLGLKKFHHKTLNSVVTGYQNFRKKRFWFAFGLWSVIVFVSVGVEYALSPSDFIFVFKPQGFIIGLVLMLLLMPIQTGFEEVFFRGYLVQGLSQVFKNGIIPLLLTSLLFGAAHMTNPEVEKYGWQMMLPYYSGFGLFLGALTLLDEGLELSFGIHMANNLISSLLITSKESVLKTYSVFEVQTEDPVAEIILTFVMIAIASGILWFKYRWKNFNLIIK